MGDEDFPIADGRALVQERFPVSMSLSEGAGKPKLLAVVRERL